MKIIIPGGTGQVGRVLVPALRAHGHDVIVLSRGARPGAGILPEWPAAARDLVARSRVRVLEQ